MNVWRFFRVPDNLDDYDNIRSKDKFPLYAITTNKKDMKSFLLGRRNESFICKKSEQDKDEVIEYLNKNRGKVLKYYRLYTYKGNDLRKSVKIEVLMCEDEYNIMSELMETYSIFNDIPYVTPDVFTKKVQKHLIKIQYVSSYQLFTSNTLDTIDVDYPNLDFEYDELGVFVEIFDIILDEINFPKTIRYR